MAYISQPAQSTWKPPIVADHRDNSYLSLVADRHGTRSQVISRNYAFCPGISFFSCHEDGIGVSLAGSLQSAQQAGIMNPDRLITEIIPNHVHAKMFQNANVIFSINWPGYQHLKWKHKFILKHPDRTPYTVGEMANQVAHVWHHFINEQSDEFKGPGIRLGPLFVSLNDLRLHELYTSTGTTWQAEISYVLP